MKKNIFKVVVVCLSKRDHDLYWLRFTSALLSLTNGRRSWVVGVGVGVGVGEELIMIIHTKLIATFALCRIALRRHPVKSPKNYTIFVRILPFVPKLGFFFIKCTTRNKLGDI